MSKQKFASADGGGFNRETWLTPPHILQALGEFDLDPCAAPSPRPWPTAVQHIELPVNGLEQPWHGRVWCNPPYGAEAGRWLAKLADHGNGIALVFARPRRPCSSTRCGRRRTGSCSCAGAWLSAIRTGAPSCLIGYGRNNALILRTCGLNGHFVPLEPSAIAQPGLGF